MNESHRTHVIVLIVAAFDALAVGGTAFGVFAGLLRTLV